MKQQTEDDVELRRYLLGELTHEERVAIEAQLFLDGEYLLRLKATEDELIDDYVYDELTGQAREKFETHFLAQPERHDDLSIASALKRYVSSEAASNAPAPGLAASSPPVPEAAVGGHAAATPHAKAEQWSLSAFPFKRRPVLNFSFAAAAVIIFAVMMWLAIESLRRPESPPPPVEAQRNAPQEPNEQWQPDLTANTQTNVNNRSAEGTSVAQQPHSQTGAPAGEEKPGDEQARRQIVRPRKSTSSPPTSQTPALAFLLTPGGVVREGGSANEVDAPPAGGFVLLQLPLVEQDNYVGYRATLQSGGQIIRVWKDLNATDSEAGKIVTLRVPARFLRERSYQINLAGVTTGGRSRNIDSYAFQIKEK
jgi:hypothetical protein